MPQPCRRQGMLTSLARLLVSRSGVKLQARFIVGGAVEEPSDAGVMEDLED